MLLAVWHHRKRQSISFSIELINKRQTAKSIHWRIQAPPLPGGPNSFIFMQFSAKKLKNNSTFGSCRTPLGKILDPPLLLIYSVWSQCECMCYFWCQTKMHSIGRSKGVNSFHFISFLGKFGKIVCRRLQPPSPHPRVGALTWWKSWIRHCTLIHSVIFLHLQMHRSIWTLLNFFIIERAWYYSGVIWK